MVAQSFGDLMANGQHGVQRRERVLENHADAVPADRLDFVLVEPRQIAALEDDRSLGYVNAGAEQADNGAHRRALAASRLTHEPVSFAGPDGE